MISSNNVKKIFGLNLKKLRCSRNLTQEKLAEKVGLEYKTISFIETGRAFVSSEAIASLCNYFNVEPEIFFKSRYVEPGQNELDLLQDINRLLADCECNKLQSIYNVIVALKK